MGEGIITGTGTGTVLWIKWAGIGAPIIGGPITPDLGKPPTIVVVPIGDLLLDPSNTLGVIGLLPPSGEKDDVLDPLTITTGLILCDDPGLITGGFPVCLIPVWKVAV